MLYKGLPDGDERRVTREKEEEETRKTGKAKRRKRRGEEKRERERKRKRKRVMEKEWRDDERVSSNSILCLDREISWRPGYSYYRSPSERKEIMCLASGH